MTYPSLAVIGTAGRKEDKRYLTKTHYSRMVNATIKLITHLDMRPNDIKLYSGGAAWADHVVVSLVTQLFVKAENVTLFLPTDIGEDGFFGTDEKSNKTASTCNYYHRLFSQELGISTLDQILALRELGATIDPGMGNFFQRNSSVANAVSPDGVLLAYTFGHPDSAQAEWSLKGFDPEVKAEVAGLKDGGTADTFNKAKCQKWHGRIGKDAQ